jgi:hypothetical protein
VLCVLCVSVSCVRFRLCVFYARTRSVWWSRTASPWPASTWHRSASPTSDGSTCVHTGSGILCVLVCACRTLPCVKALIFCLGFAEQRRPYYSLVCVCVYSSVSMSLLPSRPSPPDLSFPSLRRPVIVAIWWSAVGSYRRSSIACPPAHASTSTSHGYAKEKYVKPNPA